MGNCVRRETGLEVEDEEESNKDMKEIRNKIVIYTITTDEDEIYYYRKYS